MTRVSRYKLDKKLEEEVFTLFWSSIPQIKTSGAAAKFFSDLLSSTEELMLAKRFVIALLLNKGKKPVDIASILCVSFTTIHGVNEMLAHANPETLQILTDIQQKQELSAFFDNVEAFFDTLPPQWGTNWSREGKKKWERKQERNLKSTLR